VRADPRSAGAWVAGGLVALARGGVEAVRVEPLARALGVTKGSFYWHFRDRRALLDAVLARWEEVATLAIIEELEAGGGSAGRRLERLVGRTALHPLAPALEQAVRAWAAADARARRVLARVDRRRQAYVRGLLREHGLPPGTAAVRAHLLYLALVGEFARVSHRGAPAGAAAWRELSRLLLGGPGGGRKVSAAGR
jgi:AcrR family transcriptional regulator